MVRGGGFFASSALQKVGFVLVLLAGYPLISVAGAMDVVRYTTVRFNNAPESIARVQRISSGPRGMLAISLIMNACAKTPGSEYRVLLTNAKKAGLRKGDLLVTGFPYPGGNDEKNGRLSVRKLSPMELPAYGGCPRRRGP